MSLSVETHPAWLCLPWVHAYCGYTYSDQELCVLAVNGGRLQVLAGRTSRMVACCYNLDKNEFRCSLAAPTAWSDCSCWTVSHRK